MTKLAKFLVLSLSIILLLSFSAYATSQKPVKNHTQKDIIAELGKANIVYLGETHDSAEDARSKLEIVKKLYSKNPRMTMAMEMFQRPFQQVLDEYIAGKIDEQQLIQKSEYEERWGFNWEYYASILRFAKANRIRVLALNTPSEITTKVSTQGLQSLTKDELNQIPPVAEIRTDDRDYRQILQKVYQQHMHGAHGNSEDFESFFTAQVLWDETMAETIAQFFGNNPDNRIVVLAGKGHIIYGYGIPDRVTRRLLGKSFVQRSVLLGNFEEKELQNEKSPANYFWQ